MKDINVHENNKMHRISWGKKTSLNVEKNISDIIYTGLHHW